MRIMPRKNAGMLRNRRLSTVNVRSRNPYWRSALVMPIGMPMSSSKKMPNVATARVAGNRCRIEVATGSWVS